MFEMKQENQNNNPNASRPTPRPVFDPNPSPTRRALEGVSQSSTPAALARRGELEEVSSGLEEMKKEWKRWQL